MRKSDGLRVHYKKERWGESSPREKEGRGGVHNEKESDGVRVYHKKKSDGVRENHKRELWGESLP